MDLPARRQPRTVRLRRLSNELLKLRTAAGMTREQVEERTNINAATIYRLESAKGRPQKRTLIALLDAYGVTDEAQRAELAELSRQAAQLGWLLQYDDLPEQYTTYISLEAGARTVRNYESQFVPGLLQTEAYARASLMGVLLGVEDDEITRRVEVRLRRQESIKRKGPLQVRAVLDEAVLRRKVGGAEVMAEQLYQLAKSADSTHITLQVLPFEIGAHPGMHGSFVIMDFPDPADPALVYIENMAGDLFLERETELRRYMTVFEHLRAEAMTPAASKDFIRDLAQEYE